MHSINYNLNCTHFHTLSIVGYGRENTTYGLRKMSYRENGLQFFRRTIYHVEEMKQENEKELKRERVCNRER